LEPRAERSFGAKLRQIVRAVEIERRLSKDDILSLYLNLAPYGGNLEGIRAASLAYFGKEPRRLTIAESALLGGLPQAPEARRPPGGRAPACSTARWRPACSTPPRSPAPGQSRCRRCARRCRCWRRTRRTTPSRRPQARTRNPHHRRRWCNSLSTPAGRRVLK